MKSNMVWFMTFLSLSLICSAIWFYQNNHIVKSPVAQIMQDGKIIREIDLNAVEEPFEFTVRSTDGGINTIRAEKGRIAIVDADCPDKICVNTKYINNGATPIVCLPHKLTVAITEKNDIDAVSGVPTAKS